MTLEDRIAAQVDHRAYIEEQAKEIGWEKPSGEKIEPYQMADIMRRELREGLHLSSYFHWVSAIRYCLSYDDTDDPYGLAQDIALGEISAWEESIS